MITGGLSCLLMRKEMWTGSMLAMPAAIPEPSPNKGVAPGLEPRADICAKRKSSYYAPWCWACVRPGKI